MFTGGKKRKCQQTCTQNVVYGETKRVYCDSGEKTKVFIPKNRKECATVFLKFLLILQEFRCTLVGGSDPRLVGFRLKQSRN
ncbi:hypothetical protein CEXT_165821 [Caerostris extrusa]|uniref:Uncharacterized protein n=1 Tax=Caerostris extrusa TaxID=172846 RepID=A0AAV4MC86_CAEEX|nr:hypothetical protein CEXT_165821 [Caerostris extrusa]